MSEVNPSPAKAVSFLRARASGKFVFVGDQEFYIRGVTYGTFQPDESGNQFDPIAASRDFAEMSANGINAIRLYTVPPRWVLYLAQEDGLRVMIGIPWEQHGAFLDDPGRGRSIRARVRAAVHACPGHSAGFCYGSGHEI